MTVLFVYGTGLTPQEQKQIRDALNISLPKLNDLDIAIFLGFAEGLAFKTRQEEERKRMDARSSA